MSTATASRTVVSERPPFRADHVGSLLRPDRLKAAREQFLGPQTVDQNLGPHDNAGLRAVEDDCIREVIAMQERAGLKLATDGEFRRRSWWLELVMTWKGVSANRTGMTDLTWRNKDGSEKPFSRLWMTGPITWQPSAVVRAFEFLKANTQVAPKVTIPAPILLHMYGGGDKGVCEGHYKSADAFWADVVKAYRQELAALVKAGATYIQFDDTSIAFLCDPRHRATVQKWGNDPEQLLLDYAARMNEVIADVPPHVTLTMHQCRGNREGHWAAEGGYDPVADVLFNRINVHGYFLEYDTDRAGSFAPLRLLPKGKTVVLGVMSSKTPTLETADFLKRRIEEAARFAPLEQLAVSPQCGFASSIGGNPLGQADQEAKLARLVEVARSVWG
ncbi:MAG TPA: 5-methyltetrahydropteroyltriglutamate--homocysteine S-methyltransferase [Pseudolabrys sp.]|nr:5-methyltetrahydropteroyltriglutamate--homocysteine S-methyltransferase [Pseudolabrys sp.]